MSTVPSYRCARPGCNRAATTIWLVPDWCIVRGVAVTCGHHRPRKPYDGHKSLGFPIPVRRWVQGNACEQLGEWRDEWVLDWVREALAACLTTEEVT